MNPGDWLIIAFVMVATLLLLFALDCSTRSAYDDLNERLENVERWREQQIQTELYED